MLLPGYDLGFSLSLASGQNCGFEFEFEGLSFRYMCLRGFILRMNLLWQPSQDGTPPGPSVVVSNKRGTPIQTPNSMALIPGTPKTVPLILSNPHPKP